MGAWFVCAANTACVHVCARMSQKAKMRAAKKASSAQLDNDDNFYSILERAQDRGSDDAVVFGTLGGEDSSAT